MNRIHKLFALTLMIPSLSLLLPATGFAAAPCDLADSVGGGQAGVSPGTTGVPATALGWDVGSGQCNGSFAVTSDPTFTGGAIELGLRAEERRQGQVARDGIQYYEVALGHDTTVPAATNRAWWGFQASISYNGLISDLDILELTIRTDTGANLPVAPSFDLLALRGVIDDRISSPNPTTGFSDIYQISQNPEFGWFSHAADTDANPTGAFNYDEPGAWVFSLRAVEGTDEAIIRVCVHTPGQTCLGALPVELQEFSIE